MSLRFYIGASGSGKSTKIYEDVTGWAGQHPRTNYLILVPDQFTMQTQMDLVMTSKEKGIRNIDVLSFSRLAHRIFDEVGGDDRPVLDDTGKSLVLRRIAANLEKEVPMIGGNLKKMGYIHEVKSAISEFMQYGIGLKELKELTEYAREQGALYAKLKDLQVLYDGFLAYIKESFLTSEESLDRLRQVLDRSALIADSVVVLDGFTGFTPVQNGVICRLMQLARDVIVTVTADPAENVYCPQGEQELFYLSKKTVASLCRLAEEAGVERGEDVLLKPEALPRFLGNPALAHLERQLFRYPARAYSEEQDSIRIFQAGTVKEEVRQTCLRIRELVRREGYYYRDIGIIVGDLASYESILEEEMRRFAIPCYLDRTRGILLNPVVEYLRAALQMLLQDFSYESVFHYIRSGLAEFTPQEGDLLENYVLSWGIRGRKRYQALFVKPVRDADKEDAKEALDQINRLRERLMEQVAPLLEKKRTAGDFLRQLYAFLVQGRVQEKCSRYEKAFRAEKDLVRAREYAQIYRLVIDLLDQMEGLIGKEEMPLAEFAQILDAGFGEIQVGTIPAGVDRVVVGDVERTRLKPVKVLFFLGLNDGLIPKNTGKGGLISDMEREYLAGSGLELAPTPRQQMYIQKLYLYLHMTKPSEKLYLSYAKMAGDGKALRPSYFLDTIKELFPALQIEVPEEAAPIYQVASYEDGKARLAEALRSYADGETEKENWFLELFRLYQNNGSYDAWLEELLKDAFGSYQDAPLPAAVAKALYGDVLLGSVSRLETFAACAYAHFLQYGLALKEREGYELQAVDFGNLYHMVLEAFAARLEERGYSWFTFPREEGQAMVEEAVDSVAAREGTVFYSSARNAHLLAEVKRVLKRTVDTLQYQLQKGSFRPGQFEVSFSRLEDLNSVSVALSDTEKMRLQGRIDRVDTCETEDKVYVKVMDYKSGSRKFDLAALYHGLQLQLVVYMDAALEAEQRLYPDKEAVPAALLYYHMDEPFVEGGAMAEGEREEVIDQKIRQALIPTGLVNGSGDVVEKLDGTLTDKSDVLPVERKKDGSFAARSSVLSGEDMELILKFGRQKVQQIGRRILQGEMGLHPYEKGQESACTYCSYKKVCGFDAKLPGFSKWQATEGSREEILEQMKKEVQAHGDAVYSGSAESH